MLSPLTIDLRQVADLYSTAEAVLNIPQIHHQAPIDSGMCMQFSHSRSRWKKYMASPVLLICPAQCRPAHE